MALTRPSSCPAEGCIAHRTPTCRKACVGGFSRRRRRQHWLCSPLSVTANGPLYYGSRAACGLGPRRCRLVFEQRLPARGARCLARPSSPLPQCLHQSLAGLREPDHLFAAWARLADETPRAQAVGWCCRVESPPSSEVSWPMFLRRCTGPSCLSGEPIPAPSCPSTPWVRCKECSAAWARDWENQVSLGPSARLPSLTSEI
jgi:hypothetical protein